MVKCNEGNIQMFYTCNDEIPYISMSYAKPAPQRSADENKHRCTTTGTLANKPQQNVGDWVVVEYENVKYHGEVTCVIGSDTEVTVMKRMPHKCWSWPSRTDILYYKPENVLYKIAPPIPVAATAGGHI